ncbi:hypothetical protein IJG14_08240 [bacterium]|nr:hypothetical protein [bacterium]
MSVIIVTTSGETKFQNKKIITIGNQSNCDVVLNVPVSFVLALEQTPRGYAVINKFSTPEILFRGQSIGAGINIEKACKLMIAGTNEFIGIKIQQSVQAPVPQQTTQVVSTKKPQMQPNPNRIQRPAPQPRPQVTMSSIAEQDFDEDDIRELYGDKVNASTKIKLDKRKADIEARRVSILKEISFALEDAKKKLTANSNAEKFLFLALIFCPIVMASTITEPLQQMVAPVKSFFPIHMRMVAGYAILLFVNSLILKQGVFLLFQDKLKDKAVTKTGAVAKNFMLLISSAIFFAIGVIILSFYLDEEVALGQGPTVVSLVALFALILCSIISGYFKSTANEAAIQYDKYENREDFKKVLQDYQQWIGLYINNLSSVKLKNIRDKQFILQLKAGGEIILGIMTSPFLAYGVSNTLALCFPDAAGWIKLAGSLKFSPVFLVLATFMIVFAFFSLTAAFVSTKRVNGAEVVKNDGFNNYMHHGVDLFGTEAVKKLKSEGFRAFLIAISIIFIEFTMNVSYFMQEIGGGDWSGIFLSFVAALVPTALLVAETFMLSHTQFEIHTCEEIMSRLDKEID